MDSIKKKTEIPSSKYQILKNDKRLNCEVIHLDHSLPNFKASIKIAENGSVLFNKVCDTFGGILERDYFGLKYTDKHGQSQWLELNKSISKQVKDTSRGIWIEVFSFRFKHYPRDPINDLRQDLSKYLLYLQLRQDLFSGRMVASEGLQYRLAALILQAESEGYLFDSDTISFAELRILPSIKRKDENEIIPIYETVRDLEPFEAERIFLNEASKLDTYGVERVAVKDQKENDLFVGITFDGVTTFSDSKKMHTFLWNNIMKISFSHKLFMFKVIVEKKKHILGFQCETSQAACALWKLALDRKWFITLDRASEARRSRSGGSLFHRKKSHTFAGRSQREVTTSCQTLQRIPQPQVNRTHSMVTLLKSSHSRSESANVNGHLTSNESTGYSTLPLSQEEQSFVSESSEYGESTKGFTKSMPLSTGAVLDFMAPLSETPVHEKESLRGSDTEVNIQDIDSISLISDKINLEDENNIFSEMIEMVEREREALQQTSTAPSNDTIVENIDNHPDSLDENISSKWFPVNISVFVVCISILIGVISFFVVRGRP